MRSAQQHSCACITRRAVGKGLLSVLALMNTKDRRGNAQGNRRPYFMPPEERGRLHDLIQRQSWAKAEYARLREAASTSDGFAGAFLYALEGDPKDAIGRKAPLSSGSTQMISSTRPR